MAGQFDFAIPSVLQSLGQTTLQRHPDCKLAGLLQVMLEEGRVQGSFSVGEVSSGVPAIRSVLNRIQANSIRDLGTLPDGMTAVGPNSAESSLATLRGFEIIPQMNLALNCSGTQLKAATADDSLLDLTALESLARNEIARVDIDPGHWADSPEASKTFRFMQSIERAHDWYVLTGFRPISPSDPFRLNSLEGFRSRSFVDRIKKDRGSWKAKITLSAANGTVTVNTNVGANLYRLIQARRLAATMPND